MSVEDVRLQGHTDGTDLRYVGIEDGGSGAGHDTNGWPGNKIRYSENFNEGRPYRTKKDEFVMSLGRNE